MWHSKTVSHYTKKIRMEILEKAGYTKKGEDGGEEWITVDEDKSDDLVGNNIKDALTE